MGVAIMESMLFNVAGGALVIAIVSLGIFFTGMPGMRILKSYLLLRRIKAELEPVARAVGATTSTLCDPSRGCYMYYFSFPQEKWSFDNCTTDAWITLLLSPEGFNVHVPSFSPPIEYSDDFKALVCAVRRLKAAMETMPSSSS